jgi:leader peptidase (prepilin peptidase)/N-methyltransferase
MQLASPYWLEELSNGYSTTGPVGRVTVGLIAVAAFGVSVISAPGVIGLLGAGLALVMLTIAIIDWRCFVIPNALTSVAFGLGIVHAAVQDPSGMLTAVVFALVRGAAFASVLFLIRYAYWRIRGREGLGLGDIKLAGVAGAWLDWSFMPVTVEITACVVLLVYLVRHFALGRPIQATSRLPFGLFFAPTIWFCWLLETMLQGSL